MAGVLAIVFVVVSTAAIIFGSGLQSFVAPGLEAGWLQQVAAILVSAAFLAILHFTGILTFHEAGFVARIRPGSGRPVLIATGLMTLSVIILNFLAGETIDYENIQAGQGGAILMVSASGTAVKL